MHRPYLSQCASLARSTAKCFQTQVKRVRRKKKPVMNFLRSVTRRDGFWKCLEAECDQSLKDFATILGQPIDEDYAAFKSKLEEAVSTTLKNTKPIRTLLKA